MTEQSTAYPNQLKDKNGLTHQDLIDWHRALAIMAEPHLRRFGFEEPLPLDLDKHPEHYPLHFFVPGNNEPLDTEGKLAESYVPGYIAERDRLVNEMFVEGNHIEKVIKILSEALDNGENVYIVVDHSDLMDVVAATEMIRHLVSVYKGLESNPYPTDIVVSPAMGVIPGVMNELKKITSRILFTLPPTENANNATKHMHPDVLARCINGALRSQIEFAREGGNLIGIAPEGTTGEGDIKDGVVRLLTRGNGKSKIVKPPTNILPMKVLFPISGDESTYFRLLIGELRRCSGRDDIVDALHSVSAEAGAASADLGAHASRAYLLD